MRSWTAGGRPDGMLSGGSEARPPVGRLQERSRPRRQANLDDDDPTHLRQPDHDPLFALPRPLTRPSAPAPRHPSSIALARPVDHEPPLAPPAQLVLARGHLQPTAPSSGRGLVDQRPLPVVHVDSSSGQGGAGCPSPSAPCPGRGQSAGGARGGRDELRPAGALRPAHNLRRAPQRRSPAQHRRPAAADARPPARLPPGAGARGDPAERCRRRKLCELALPACLPPLARAHARLGARR